MSKEDLQRQRDEELSKMEHAYRARQEEVEREKEEIKSRAQEKVDKGQDASQEVKEYDEKKAVQDYYFDHYQSDRDQVYAYYENEINNEQDKEQDNEQEM